MDVGSFVDMMRQEVGVDSLDLRFNPRAPHWSDDGVGCWEVTNREPWFSVVDGEQGRVAHSSERVRVVYRLNGNYDRPLVPGRWLIHALCAADQTRHGKKTIRRQVNERLEATEEMKQREEDRLASDLAKNNDLRLAIKKRGEEVGTQLLDRADMLALEKAAAAQREELERDRLKARKETRIYGDS